MKFAAFLASHARTMPEKEAVLIERRGRVPPRDVIGIIESSMKGFPFDVIFADRADPKLLALIREEARHGSPALRAA